MDKHEARQILANCLSRYRHTSHAELASRIRDASWHHNPLDVMDGFDSYGIGYTIEVNIFWDDERTQHIRVIGDLTSSQNKGIGFIPLSVPDASDSFIMASDGCFIGE